MWWRFYQFLGDEKAADEDATVLLEAARGTRRHNRLGICFSVSSFHTRSLAPRAGESVIVSHVPIGTVDFSSVSQCKLILRNHSLDSTHGKDRAQSSLWKWARHRGKRRRAIKKFFDEMPMLSPEIRGTTSNLRASEAIKYGNRCEMNHSIFAPYLIKNVHFPMNIDKTRAHSTNDTHTTEA